MNKKRSLVIVPGRGSYTRESSNYLSKVRNKNLDSFLNKIDAKRELNNEKSISLLDRSPFKPKVHLVGENAAALTYFCSFADYKNIDLDHYDIVGILGNSMGWYTTLALSGSISLDDGYDLVNILGSMMKEQIIGGQLIYPIINDNWNFDNSIFQKVMKKISDAGAYISIYLGGYIVIGGDEIALKSLISSLDSIEDFPFKIPFHAAFHTPLLSGISNEAQKKIDKNIFKKPDIPIIDGRGFIWSKYSTNIDELYNYTLHQQVVEPFNFSKAVTVAIKELAPEKIILLGPGNSLGGPTAQVLIKNKWMGIESKESFLAHQKKNTYLISMSIDKQRSIISRK